MSDAPNIDSTIRIPPVSFGAMTFGGQIKTDKEAHRMIDICMEAGVTMFDTANSYTGGESERMLGRALADYRDRVLISTKAGNPVGGDPDQVGLGRASILRSVDDSLRRLGTDWIDLFYFHFPDRATPIEESLTAIHEVAAQGKIRAFGVSNFAAWAICEQLWIAEREGFLPPTVSQVMYNLVARRIEDEYAGFAERVGLATVIYNPLAGGLLTGKHQFEDKVRAGRFTNERYRARYWNQQQFDALSQLTELAAEAGTDIRDLSLRWVRSQPIVTSVLVGASNPGQLEDNLASLQGHELDDEVYARCDEIRELVHGVAPPYHRQDEPPPSATE